MPINALRMTIQRTVAGKDALPAFSAIFAVQFDVGVLAVKLPEADGREGVFVMLNCRPASVGRPLA